MLTISRLVIGDIIESNKVRKTVLRVAGNSALLADGTMISKCNGDELIWTHIDHEDAFEISSAAVEILHETYPKMDLSRVLGSDAIVINGEILPLMPEGLDEVTIMDAYRDK